MDTRVSNTYRDEQGTLINETHIQDVGSIKTTYNDPHDPYNGSKEYFDKNHKSISSYEFDQLKFEHESTYERPPYLDEVKFDIEPRLKEK